MNQHSSSSRQSTRARDTRRRRRATKLIAGATLAVTIAAACGSSSSSKGSGATTTTSFKTLPQSTTLGDGVTASTIKLGVALVDFSQIRQYTDLIRTDAEQKQIYNIYINYINAHGGIAGRTIVPDFKFYSPLGSAVILSDCTAWAQDDHVFAVVGTFIDFSGDAQTCIAKQQKRVLMTFNLTQAIIDRSPGGLIVTPGDIPERVATVLISLLQKNNTLKNKKVAVLGDGTEAAVVNKTVVPELKKAHVSLGSTAVLSVSTTGDTTAAQQQLESFIEKWKTEDVNTVFLSGDLASTKQFVQVIKRDMPKVLLLADNTDVIDQAQQLQEAKVKPNPYEGVISAAGPTPHEYDTSANWKYCSTIYKDATHKAAPDAEHTIKTKDGKIDDTYGTINDACQVMTMFHDIAQRVGKYLNDTNWINTVNTFGTIENRGSGPYSSLHANKYDADDNWRLQSYDSKLGNAGLWKPLTPLQDISS